MNFANKLAKIIKRCIVLGTIVCVLFLSLCFAFGAKLVFAMPFYDLQPEALTLRASFYTSYSSSTKERKHNIALASKSLNNVFVDVGGEFSFNKTVGERTEKRGYKKAKIISGGEFVDGVGGGVCQVSSTLYNAVLLSGLEIVEFHPHSLPVGYVAPSFDAMVNSGWADLKFRNNTHNPIIIKTFATEDRLLIEIHGQKMNETYQRESVVTSTILPLEEQIVFDELGAYPDLYEGETRQVRYAKNGYTSEGYIVKIANGKKQRKKIRTDKYGAIRGLVVQGTAKKPIDNSEENNIIESQIKNSLKLIEKLLNDKKYFDKNKFL